MLQAKPLIEITLSVVAPWQMAREMLCSTMGMSDCPAPMEWKKHGADYNYAWGVWNSSHRALALMTQLFLLVHLVTIAALGSAWLEGLKIMGVNFFLCIAICFGFIAQNKLTGGKPYFPMVIMLAAALGVAYTLAPVQELIYPKD